MPTPARQLWTRLAVVFAIWTVLAVILTGQAYLIVYTSILAHDDVGHLRPSLALTELFLTVLGECLIWAVLTLGIFWLAKRFPLRHGQWLRSVLVHLLGCFVCGMIAAVLSAIVAELVRSELPRITLSMNVLLFFFVAKLNNNIFFYPALLAVATVV